MTVLAVAKEILGVNNALYIHEGTATSCRTVNTPARRSKLLIVWLLIDLQLGLVAAYWARIQPRPGIYTYLYIKRRRLERHVPVRARGCDA